MNNRINLYRPYLRPVKEFLPLNYVVVIWVLVIAFCAAGTWYFEQVVIERQQIADRLLNQINTEKVELDDLKKKNSERKVSPVLLNQLALLNEELTGKRALTQHLTGQTLPGSQHYSDVMKDIAKLHHNQIWLTDLHLGERKIVLKGIAVKASDITVWMSGLRYSKYFSGKEFEFMQIRSATEDNLEGYIEFEIRSVGEIAGVGES